MSVIEDCKSEFPLTLDDHVTSLDGDIDPLGDLEQFLGMAAHNRQLLFPLNVRASALERGFDYDSRPASLAERNSREAR
jgi:hypothetical protein